jgi:hypothetical protein
MGRTPSQHQAEIIAIMRAAKKLLQYASQGQIIIHTNSQTALRALENPIFTSKTALATSMALDTLARASTTSVVLSWSKPNPKHAGVAKPISLANDATTLDPREEEPVTTIPITFVKACINSV